MESGNSGARGGPGARNRKGELEHERAQGSRDQHQLEREEFDVAIGPSDELT